MSCVRRTRLEQKYVQASATCDGIRQRLRERIGICPKSEFLALSDDLDRATEVLYHARRAFESHIRQHCCLSKTSVSTSEDRP
jgi:hypothetical protein